jgi:hypothetical protein
VVVPSSGGAVGRGTMVTGLAPEGLSPELPPEVPGLDAPVGALVLEGWLLAEGELPPGSLSLEGWLPVEGRLS